MEHHHAKLPNRGVLIFFWSVRVASQAPSFVRLIEIGGGVLGGTSLLVPLQPALLNDFFCYGVDFDNPQRNGDQLVPVIYIGLQFRMVWLQLYSLSSPCHQLACTESAVAYEKTNCV